MPHLERCCVKDPWVSLLWTRKRTGIKAPGISAQSNLLGYKQRTFNMRWRKHVFVVVVMGSQMSLLVALVYLIKFCNRNLKFVREREIVDRKTTDSDNYLSKFAGKTLNTMTTFKRSRPPTLRLTSFVYDRGTRKRRDNNTKEISSSVIRQEVRKKHLKLIVAMLSAPIRFDRREGIRRTWFKECGSEEVVCRFFTDSLSDMESNVRDALANESARHGDLEFMPVPKGYNFGLRLLWLMEWSLERYDFDFFLRMDDDYFVCLKRLLFELPYRPQKRLYWGNVHCEIEGLVRVDEGFLILSGDLVQEFMAKKDELLCHPFGDQTIAIWMNDVKHVIFFHDPRIFHEVTAHIPEFKLLQEVCQTYISLHGSYLHEMLLYWGIASKNNYSTYWVPSIQPISNLCPLNTHFDWRAMGGPPYGWEPKPCVLKPVWNLGHMHRGRNMM